MKDLRHAALYETLQGMIEDIDTLLEEYGFDPADYDEDAIENGEVGDKDIAAIFTHVLGLKAVIEG